jgi:lipopolysaccharide biosynthesis glycosyltransferase
VQVARIRRVLGRLRDPRTRGDTVRRIRTFVAHGIAGGAVRGDSGADSMVRRAALEATLARAIARGETLEAALLSTVRALAETDDWGDWNAGWAISEGVAGLPGGEIASRLGHAVLDHHRHRLDRVWRGLEGLSDASLATHVPVEAVDGALATGTDVGLDRATAIALAVTLPDPVAVDLTGRFLAVGAREAAEALATDLRRRARIDLDERRHRSWQLIEAWLHPKATRVPADAVPIGVLTYRTPDHVLTSGNLGDLIQTLAAVGNLVRYRGVTFGGDDGLGSLATELQRRVRPDLRLDVPGLSRRNAYLLPVDRDFSSAADIPSGTWLLAFGWHMHPLYNLRYDFPYHPNVQPLFVSFHVNRLDMLSGDGIAYLRRHAPIGCRDWNTVFLLLSAGIDAFFSGCMTTTVDGLFPTRAEVYHGGGAVAVIDLPNEVAGGGAIRISHQSDDFRSVPLTDGLRIADAALGRYQRELSGAITGRLHAYLPLTALGVPVEFRHARMGDPRFAGLMGLRPGDGRLEAIRGGLRAILGPTLAKVVAGAPRGEVYRTWRELTSPLVAEARARFEAPVVDAPTSIDIPTVVATIRAAARSFGPADATAPDAVTNVAVAFDQNVTWPAAVLIESLVEQAAGPIHLWILARGLDEAFQDWLGAAFAAVPITFLPCDGVGYGPRGRPRRLPSRITISSMDRLFLPLLLDDVKRAVYLDVDTLILDDIGRLAGVDLEGHPIASWRSPIIAESEWQRAGMRLTEELALELRRSMARRHGFGAPALNAGVLVLDLERMRRDRFTATALGWVERYGLHDQDAMLAYAGPDRLDLDPAWNAMPVLADPADPRLIHWASFGKPWDPPVTYGKELWQAFARRLHDRAGAVPR